MKLQAHLPTVSIGARDWRAAMIALASLSAVAVLMLASQSGVLLNNPLLERMRTSPVAPARISIAHRISFELQSLSIRNNPARRFSVAHPLPENVTPSQLFSVGLDARISFEVFGEAALRNMLAGEKTMHQLKPRNDRMLLMLMLLRLRPRRS
jgi:hypothetical protein